MVHKFNLRNIAGSIAAVFFVLGAVLFRAGYTSMWIIVICVVASAVWVIDYVRGERHRSEYKEFAALHGWDYAQRSFDYNSRFVSTPFGVGNAQHQLDVLRGKLNGLECATFTHQYEQQHTPNGESTKYVYQVTLVELPVTLPRLELIPESMAQRVAKTLGAQDIDFESHEFNRLWRVRASDRKYAHDVLDPRMLERLIQLDAQGGMIRIEGGAVMTWQAGRGGVSGLASRLGVLTGIARRIPDHVIREYTDRGYGAQRGMYAPGADRHRPLAGPDWAVTPGALTSNRYTGIGSDDGSGPYGRRTPPGQ